MSNHAKSKNFSMSSAWGLSGLVPCPCSKEGDFEIFDSIRIGVNNWPNRQHREMLCPALGETREKDIGKTPDPRADLSVCKIPRAVCSVHIPKPAYLNTDPDRELRGQKQTNKQNKKLPTLKNST